MSDGTGLAEALLGLDGFRVLEVTEVGSEVVIDIETTIEVVGCSTCGTRPKPKTAWRRDPRPGLLRASGTAGVAQAALALHRRGLRGEDVGPRFRYLTDDPAEAAVLVDKAIAA